MSLNPLLMLSLHGRMNSSVLSSDTLTVEVVHGLTGQRIRAPLTLFSNMDAFKHHITQTFAIDTESLFLLTPFGVKLKFTMLLNQETDTVYAFDRKFFSPVILNGDEGVVNDPHLKQLMHPLISTNNIAMIKPRDCPLVIINMKDWINDLSLMVNDDDREVNSSELDFDGLRLIINSLKRTSSWASALLSDFKSSVFKSSNDGQEDINNILESLNVLSQYVNLLFYKLEKDVNDSIDAFSTLSKNSLSDRWQEQFSTLEKLEFSLKAQGKIESITLALLLDQSSLKQFATKSKFLNSSINESLVNLKDLIDETIITEIDFITSKYNEYKEIYLSTRKKQESNDLTMKCQQLFQDLEIQINLMNNEVKNIPSFSELIVTTDPNTPIVSSESVIKIRQLIQTFNIQINERVPVITNLVQELYETQINGLSNKGELQKDIITSFFSAIVKVQLSIRKITKLHHSEIVKPLNILKQTELHLSITSDLPLVFGIWIIAILSNLKNGMSIDKLIKKTSEILEMVSYVENLNQSKWLDDFINGVGKDKVEVLGLNDIDLKLRFSKGLFAKSQFKLINGTKTDIKIGDVDNLLSNDRKLSFDAHYLQPLNKIIQNFQHHNTVAPSEATIDNKQLEGYNNEIINKYTSSLPLKLERFFSLMIKCITLGDVIKYIDHLKSLSINDDIVNQLNQYIQKLGVSDLTASSITRSQINDQGEILIKNGDINGHGTFDKNDGMFLKIFKKFLKGFEIEGVTIEIVTSSTPMINDGLEGGADYEMRIKKLEGLLHEKQFEDFNSRWSKRGIKPIDLSRLNLSNDQDLTKLTAFQFGKFIDLPPSHYTETFKVLDEENSKLRREIAKLKEAARVNENNSLKGTINDLQDEIEELKQQIAQQKTKLNSKDITINDLKNELQSQKEEFSSFKKNIIVSTTEIEELRETNKDLIANMSHKEEEYQKENQLNIKEKNDLKHQLDEMFEHILVLTELNDKFSVEMKNVFSAVNEISKIFECMAISSKDLSSVIMNNFETICLVLESMGLMVSKESNNDLPARGESILDDTIEYADINDQDSYVDTYGKNFTFTDNDRFVINRAKGLRNKKKDILIENYGDDVDFDQIIYQLVSKDILEECKKRIDWFPTEFEFAQFKFSDKMIGSFEEINSSKISEQLDEHVKQTDDLFEMFRDQSTKLMGWISEFDVTNVQKKFNSFVSIAHLDEKLVILKAHKRFDDVETLARKLTKEKAQLKTDIKELKASLKNRLVLRNFAMGDLVLFLKTVIPNGRNSKILTPIIDSDASYSLENSEDISLIGLDSVIPSSSANSSAVPRHNSHNNKTDNGTSEQSWTIFNIGSPNYYLKNQDKSNLKNRDWFVGRITKLEEHVVTETNLNNNKKNPFRLELNSKWYYVYTDEEKSLN